MCQLSPVAFHGDTIFCLEYEGQPFTPMRPIVENLGLDWGSQSAKINTNKKRWTVAIIATVAQDGIEREMLCLPLRKLPAWFASIHPNKVRPELREKIELYQNECDDALWNYWMNGKAERKTDNQSSDTPIGPADQNILQTIVRTKVGALLDASHKGGFPQIWSRFNDHFRLGSYKQLPQSKMAEAVAYLVKMEVREKKKELPQTSAVLEQYSDKAQAALEKVKDKSAQFMYALFDLQKSIDVKEEHKKAIPVAARKTSGSVRQMATSIGVSLSALTDLVDLYCGNLTPRTEQFPQFPSAIVSNIPGPRPGDRYYAYLEKIEVWRVATIAEREKLFREGVALLDVGRMGGEMFHVCADYLSLWLKDGVLSSNTSVFDELLRHNRAPVMLAKFLNTNFEDVRKYFK